MKITIGTKKMVKTLGNNAQTETFCQKYDWLEKTREFFRVFKGHLGGIKGHFVRGQPSKIGGKVDSMRFGDAETVTIRRSDRRELARINQNYTGLARK